MKTIRVTGMSCSHCQAAVKAALEELGLTQVTVSLEEGTASFAPDASVSDEAVAAAVEEAGFQLG